VPTLTRNATLNDTKCILVQSLVILVRVKEYSCHLVKLMAFRITSLIQISLTLGFCHIALSNVIHVDFSFFNQLNLKVRHLFFNSI
jgi:hypothetical protein